MIRCQAFQALTFPLLLYPILITRTKIAEFRLLQYFEKKKIFQLANDVNTNFSETCQRRLSHYVTNCQNMTGLVQLSLKLSCLYLKMKT